MKPFWTRIPEGGLIPSYMGFAWWRYETYHKVAILFPFNHLVALLRRAWHMIRHVTETKREKAECEKIHEAWVKGKKEGRLDGFIEVRNYLIANKFNEGSFAIALIDILAEKKRKIYKMEDYKT